MLMVLYLLSQIVGVAEDFCGPWHATPGPTLFWPVPVGGSEGLQFGSVALPYPHLGIGPREEPSHVSQPTAQPFENQKHDWPLKPVTSPLGFGAGHHPV